MTGIAHYVDDPKTKKLLRETDGIGTPATQAQIIQTLQERRVVEKRGRQIISTAIGRALLQTLPEVATKPDMTALWEAAMRRIAGGQMLLPHFWTKCLARCAVSSIAAGHSGRSRCQARDPALRLDAPAHCDVRRVGMARLVLLPLSRMQTDGTRGGRSFGITEARPHVSPAGPPIRRRSVGAQISSDGSTEPMYSWIGPKPSKNHKAFRIWFRGVVGIRAYETFATEIEALSFIARAQGRLVKDGRPIEEVVDAYLASLTKLHPSSIAKLRYRLRAITKARERIPIEAFPWATAWRDHVALQSGDSQHGICAALHGLVRFANLRGEPLAASGQQGPQRRETPAAGE